MTVGRGEDNFAGKSRIPLIERIVTAPLPSRDEVVACLRASGKPLHAGDIAKRCGVPRDAFQALIEMLQDLATEGFIRLIGRNRYGLRKAPPRDSWVGILAMNARGFAFVTASGKPDVYVPPPGIGAAMHGDTVRIEVVGANSRGSEGRVLDVEKRRDPRVAGTVRRNRKSAWLEPDDPRIRGPIVLREGQDVCRDGDAAVVEIVRFPEHVDENPEGKVERVLGTSGDAQVEVEKILVREQIHEAHPALAMAEAERLVMKARRLELGSREDLRQVPFLTIDPSDARDHDDAVYAEKTANGFRVYVAIADVSEYVQPGTALDDEARSRGCTLYLPDRAVPMLPGVLAADMCSLLPDCERYCVCVIVDLDQSANPGQYRVVEGLMRAAAMISYESAARTLGFTEIPAKSPQAEAFKKPLKVLASIAQRLRKVRLDRGALDMDLPEAKLVIDEETSVPLEVKQQKSDPGVKRAYQLVEEMMLLANELVARWLGKRNCPAVYRVHGKPDEMKLERLGKAADALDAPFDLEQMQEATGVGDWLHSVRNHPARLVLESLLLRSLKQAVYDITNIGHFGLASDAYVHFTSPIRRYPDLLIHRAIKRILRGGAVDRSPEALESLAAAATQSSFRERAAMQVEREVVDLYRTLFMRERIGDRFQGRVTALLGSGIIVAIAEPFVEVMIRFDDLGPDRYEISDDELSYVGLRSNERITLGDTVDVLVVDVSIGRRTVYASRVVEPRTSKRPGKSEKGGRERRKEAPKDERPRASRGGPARRDAKPAPAPPARARSPKRPKGR
jgi:ribonuclease R